jgi:nucleoside-triphosphatase
VTRSPDPPARDRIRRSVLLLTGVPGIGKTTVIRRVAERLKGRKLGGFYTEEIREDGDRRGFRLVGFDGTERVIAHVSFPKARRVGKYGVDVGAIDEATELLADDPAVQVYLVDEIGKMECLSERFVAAVRTLLSDQSPLSPRSPPSAAGSSRRRNARKVPPSGR